MLKKDKLNHLKRIFLLCTATSGAFVPNCAQGSSFPEEEAAGGVGGAVRIRVSDFCAQYLPKPLETFISGDMRSYMNVYLGSLPTIDTAHHAPIAQFLLQFRLSDETKDGLPDGTSDLEAKIKRLTAEGKRLDLVLMGFPHKSTCDAKVLGRDVDLGELVAMITLNHLCQEIGKVYAPGARIHVFSDREAYADLFMERGIETGSDAYFVRLTQLVENFFADTISFSLVPREEILSLKGTVMEEMSSDPSKLATFEETKGYYRRGLADEFRLDKGSEDLESILHHFVLNAAVCSKAGRSRFPDAIHLSVHPYQSVKDKVGISLGFQSRGTPWHHAPVVVSGGALEHAGITNSIGWVRNMLVSTKKSKSSIKVERSTLTVGEITLGYKKVEAK